MNNIPDDVVWNITEFLDCKDALLSRTYSRAFNTHCKCTASHFGEPENRINGCAIHVKRYPVSSVINTLLNTPEKPVTIHFRTLHEMNIGRPYLGQFGEIHHDCCSGVGVMYVDTNLMLIRNYEIM